MNAITIGPLALPIAPLVVIVACWLASWVAGRLAPAASKEAARSEVWRAWFLGLVVARLAQVALHAALYLEEPLSMLNLADGGWHAPAGVGAAMAWLAYRLLPRAPLRKPVGVGVGLGLALWLGAASWQEAQRVRPLPELALTSLASGVPTTLKQMAKGGPMVINLWATWCAPCRAEMPAFAKAQSLRPDVAFVFANQGEAAELAKRFLGTLAIPLEAAVLDPNWSLAQAVGTKSLPTTLFVDAQGRIVHTHVGQLSRAALLVQVNALKASP